MKTILLTLIASTIGILSLAAAPVIQTNGTLIRAEVLTTLPPGWEVISMETVFGNNGYPRERVFLLNPTTKQIAVWLIEFHS
jgi:hypothetical protein